MCSRIVEAPEDRFGDLKALLELCEDVDAQVARLAMLSLVQVFKNICPGYKIRQLSEAELDVKVSKDVKRIRNFEMGLLASYQSFLKHLLAKSKAPYPKDSGAKDRARVAVDATRRVAAQCMCQLVQSLPHFNYRVDLLTSVVQLILSRDLRVRSMCTAAVREVLARDTEMDVAVDAVQLVGDLLRTSLKPLAKILDKLNSGERAASLHLLTSALYRGSSVPPGRCVAAGESGKGMEHRARKLLQRPIPPECVSCLEVLSFTELTPGGDNRPDGKSKKGKKRDKKDKELDRDMAEGEAAITDDERRRSVAHHATRASFDHTADMPLHGPILRIAVVSRGRSSMCSRSISVCSRAAWLRHPSRRRWKPCWAHSSRTPTGPRRAAAQRSPSGSSLLSSCRRG